MPFILRAQRTRPLMMLWTAVTPSPFENTRPPRTATDALTLTGRKFQAFLWPTKPAG